MSESEDAELLQVFLEEAREHLDGIEGDLLQLESGSDVDLEIVNKIFRAVHSVKGGAGFFGLISIKTLSHAMENVLGAMRKGQLTVTPQVIGVLLRAADSLVHMIDSPAESAEAEVSDFIRDLEAVSLGGTVTTHTTSGASPIAETSGHTRDTAPTEAATGAAVTSHTKPTETETTSALSRRPRAPAPVEEAAMTAPTHAAATSAPTHEPAASDPSRDAVPPNQTNARANLVQAANPRPGLPLAETTVRVHVGVLDRLMTLAGESGPHPQPTPAGCGKCLEQQSRSNPAYRSHHDGTTRRDHVDADAVDRDRLPEVQTRRT
ncbi:MAG: Hpt domain-containing protein [Polyangiaceae bacterium]